MLLRITQYHVDNYPEMDKIAIELRQPPSPYFFHLEHTQAGSYEETHTAFGVLRGLYWLRSPQGSECQEPRHSVWEFWQTSSPTDRGVLKGFISRTGRKFHLREVFQTLHAAQDFCTLPCRVYCMCVWKVQRASNEKEKKFKACKLCVWQSHDDSVRRLRSLLTDAVGVCVLAIGTEMDLKPGLALCEIVWQLIMSESIRNNRLY